MTDIATDLVDLGALAVIGEAFATPENQTSVTVVALVDAPDLRPDFRTWEYIVGETRVVLADVCDGLGLPDGIIEHFGQGLGTDPVELGSCDIATAKGSVLLIEGPQGPALVGFVAPMGSAQPPVDRRDPDSLGEEAGGLLSLGILREVPLDVSAELGHTRLSVAEILQLTVGSVIELDRPAGAPVDVVVNGSLIARGEVVVIDDEYGVRITEIVGRIGDTI